MSRDLDLTAAPTTDPLRIYRYRDGLYAVDLLTTAIAHLNLFTRLADHPSSAEEVCAHYGFAERPVDVMLTLCVANNLLEQREGVFHVTSLAREHLTATSPWNLEPYYAALKERPIANDFLTVLKTDRPAGWGGGASQPDWHTSMMTDAFSKSFTAAMDCRGRYLGQALAKALDFSGRRALLDVGGGSGIYACALVARHPHLRGIVYEQSPVDRIAVRSIAERGFADVISVATGDMFKDAWPRGCDVHLFSNVLHDWGTDGVRALLSISRRAIADNGLLVIHEAFINAEKTGPLPVAEYSALLMHSSQGKCYSIGEYAALLSESGFQPGEYRDTVVDRGFMTAIAV